MSSIDRIEIIPTENVPNLERINAQLKTLVLAHEGTIPGSRGFGLPGDFLDLQPGEALNVFAIELEEKTAEYIPSITIDGVSGNLNMEGTWDVAISISGRDDANGSD